MDVSYFGPPGGIDNKDYVLAVQDLEGVITDPPLRLWDHGLASLSANLSDQLVVSRIRVKNGQVITQQRVKRAPYLTSVTTTINIPTSIMSPVRLISERGGGCPYTFFLLYLCGEDQYQHAYVLPEGTLEPFVEATELVSNSDDTASIVGSVNVQFTTKDVIFNLAFRKLYTATDVNINEIAFSSVTCPDCANNKIAQRFFIAGGDGTAAPTLVKTTDRFSNVTSQTSGAADATHHEALYTDGDLVLVFASDRSATPPAGTLHRSVDGGATWAAVSGVTENIQSIVGAGGSTIVAAGGETTNGAVLYLSTNRGASFTSITSAVLPSDQSITQIAWDSAKSKLYLVDSGGAFYSGTISGTNIIVTDLSAGLPGSPTAFSSVAVLAENHVMIGGASGYVAESFNGGATWRSVDFPGTATVSAIAGTVYRQLAGAGTGIYERDPMTDFLFKAKLLEDGVTLTGNVTSIAYDSETGVNYFAVATDDGEILVGTPRYKYA